MANNKSVYQQTNNVSIPKNRLLDITADEYFGKKTYKVLLCLFTELNGFDHNLLKRSQDPLNFKKIDFKAIAQTVGLSKDEVKKCVNNLIDWGYVEEGCSDTVNDGYRFTF